MTRRTEWPDSPEPGGPASGYGAADGFAAERGAAADEDGARSGPRSLGGPGARGGFGEGAGRRGRSGTRGSGSPSSSRAGEGEPRGSAEPRDPVEQARGICLRLLTGTPRTRKQLADALRKREIPDEAAEEVLSRFEDVGLIDDAAFAGAWVESRHHGRGLARRAWSGSCGRRAWTPR